MHLEVEMRAAQYFLFPCAKRLALFSGFIVCFGASIGYLVNRKAKYDLFAYAAAEVGLLFGAIVLTTGHSGREQLGACGGVGSLV